MKINLKHPKYIAPLLGLPFVIGIPFLFGLGQTPSEESQDFQLQETQGINTAVPQPIIDQNEKMDKMDAYSQYFKDLNQESDFLMSIEEDSIVNELIELGYTPNEVRQIYWSNQQMRIRNISESNQQTMEDSLALWELHELDPEFFDSIETFEEQVEVHDPIHQNHFSNEVIDQSKEWGAQAIDQSEGMGMTQLIRSMNQESERAIIRQHFLMDSLENPEKYQSLTNVVSRDSLESVKMDSMNEKSATDLFFNSTTLVSKIEKIKAIIDQEVQIVMGSRVPIRLLEELVVGDTKLPSGQRLYALVSGFQSQRVLLSITSAVFDTQVIPLSIDIYDQDGMEGLFVPESKFRNIARDIGASAMPDVSIETPVRTTTEMVFETVNQAMQTGSDFLRKSITKNKAILKYNTVLYLVVTNEAP
ncbi:MAG: conjugative transposon protein TraM [Flavobacteriaceae bacterium]|nr:conjugative transposon protein TraM [Flavobacteriaceae bacterium]MCY4268448.1 conjugative transposon protein TraM [Flavobacteriaceae bacterium]